MATTTIPLERDVRDRLRGFGHAGMTYNDILTQLMDKVDRETFVAALRKELDTTKDWVDLEDL